jgi:hypothetical protein
LYGTHVQIESNVNPWGAVFAPSEFGEFGDRLLVSDGQMTRGDTDLDTLAIDEHGAFETFATIPLTLAQREAFVGLRQMAVVPDGYGDLSGLLLVSIAGSSYGNGVIGEVVALNHRGEIVRQLKVGSKFDKLDPRGLYFAGEGKILIVDASDPVIVARPNDFVAVPEPSPIWLTYFSLLLGTMGLRRRR